MKIILCLSIIMLQVLCAPQNDLVDLTQISQLPQNYQHKWYSGYLQASVPGDTIYYSFFESQNDPAKDPVILWLQGGPGCSGMFGAFIENGPIIFYPSSTESYLNQYAWNMNASVLYVETPAGVGFSYSQKNTSNDVESAADNLAALLDFFGKFSEYSQNEFYISGESYGGIYIPFLATAILESNKQSSNTQINLKGFILGNGCTLGAECTNTVLTPLIYSVYEFQQFNDHGFFSPQEWKEYQEVCGNTSQFDKFVTPKCLTIQNKTTEKINYNYLDLDNINGICYHVPKEFQQTDDQPVARNSYKQSNKRKVSKLRSRHNTLKNSHIVPELPCDYEVGDYYLYGNDTVRNALHINVSVSDLSWDTCTNDSTFIYTETINGSYHLYPNLLQSGLKIWIYSGDVDANVPITGTLTWIQLLQQELDLKEVEEWRPWFITNEESSHLSSSTADNLQVGGMFWDLDKIQFVSVRGAGHEVPFWKPQSAFVMIQNYLSGNQLPSTKGKITQQLSMADTVMKHYLKRQG